MNRIKVLIAGLVAIVLSTGCVNKQDKPVTFQEVIAEHPEKARIVFENDYVYAVKVKLKPGEKLPLHEGERRVVYSLSDYKIKWTEDGRVEEKQWQKGDSHLHHADAHAVENTGDTDAEYLVVTRTAMALPDAGESLLSGDMSKVDSLHAEILLEDDDIRVLEVKLDTGKAQPKHDGLNRLIYSLSDYQIEYTYYIMDNVETEMERGYIHWHTADKHSVKNVGDTPAHYLLFGFKK
jgi:quercetin dioxygenase-like cupin family protein